MRESRSISLESVGEISQPSSTPSAGRNGVATSRRHEESELSRQKVAKNESGRRAEPLTFCEIVLSGRGIEARNAEAGAAELSRYEDLRNHGSHNIGGNHKRVQTKEDIKIGPTAAASAPALVGLRELSYRIGVSRKVIERYRRLKMVPAVDRGSGCKPRWLYDPELVIRAFDEIRNGGWRRREEAARRWSKGREGRGTTRLRVRPPR